MEQQTGSQLGKEYFVTLLIYTYLMYLHIIYIKYIKAVICHLAYLTYMQSTSCEMLSWMNHRLKSMLPGVITTSDNADDTTLMAESKEELKSLLVKVKEESEKADLKLNIQKTKVMASSPITSWQMEKNGNSSRFYSPVLQNHCGW